MDSNKLLHVFITLELRLFFSQYQLQYHLFGPIFLRIWGNFGRKYHLVKLKQGVLKVLVRINTLIFLQLHFTKKNNSSLLMLDLLRFFKIEEGK